MTTTSPSNPLRPSGRWLTLVWLVAATVFFGVRGPMRSLSNSADLFLIYAASRTWLSGANPYDRADQRQTIARLNADHALPDVDLLSLYPPTMFVVMAPVSWGTWPLAKALWTAVNLAAMGALILGALRWAKLSWRQPRGTALVGLLLIFGPIITGFNVGQIALVCTAMVMWALHLQRSGQGVLAGGLLGIAIALKPQLAGLFWLYWLARGQWRPCLISVAVWTGLAAIAVVQLGVADLTWAHDLLANLRQFSQVGGLASTDAHNPVRHQLINLAYPVQALIAQARGTSLIVATALLALLGATWKLLRNRKATASEDHALLILSLLALITLMATYHRTYDAVLLVFPLAWALGPGWRRTAAGPMALAWLLIFVVPIPIVLTTASRQGIFSPHVTESWMWQTLVLPSTAWMLPILAMTLLIHAFARLAPHAKTDASATVK